MGNRLNKIKTFIFLVSLCTVLIPSDISLAKEKTSKQKIKDVKQMLYNQTVEELLKDVEKIEEKANIKRKTKKSGKRGKEVKKEPLGMVEKKEEKHKLSLSECIVIAIENHLPLTIAKKQLALAQFRLLEATRKLGPSVTAKWEESTGMVSNKVYTGKKIAFEGKQPLFYGGELVFSVKQAKANLEIVKNDYDRIKNELILQVKKAYYSLDKAKRALRIQKKLYDRTKELYDIAKSGYEAAVVPQIEFLKVSSQYNQANFQVISAEEDTSIANLLLQQAMNVDEEVEVVEVEEPKIIDLGLEDCFNLAYFNRPELKINQLSLEYFGYEKKIMKARANWPRVDLLGSYGNTREDYTSEYVGADWVTRNLGPEYYFGTKISIPFWGSTVGYSFTREDWQPVVQTTHGTEATTHTMTFSLFDKLEDISGVQEAELEHMRSQDEMNKKKQEIALEVKEMFFKYKKAVLLINVAKSKVEFQTKQVEILDIRRQLSEAQYSDVIEEIIRLAEEEFSYIQAISDYYIAIASLNKAIGINDYFEI